MNYYNEFDPQSAAWIQELINRRLIPDGHVDTRSITEISPSDLHGYTQCHFFAGIAGWSLALRIAGIPATRPLWTGSCPCQPFSVAGEGKGIEDDRHLWPVFFGLIRECQPELIFGEQVASAAVLGSASKPTKRDAHKPIQPVWFDGICADLETANYACGAADIPAAGVGAPHIRQRLYWGAVRMANAIEPGLEGYGRDVHHRDQSGRIGADQAGPVGESREPERLGHTPGGGLGIIGDASLAGSCGHTHGSGDTERMEHSECSRRAETGMRHEIDSGRELESGCACGGMADPSSMSGPQHEREPRGCSRWETGTEDGAECRGDHGGMGIADGNGREPGKSSAETAGHGHSTISTGGWDDAYWHPCRDGKYRRVPVESRLFPLADGLPYRMARRRTVRPPLLRGSGNAIVPEVAAEFIKAFDQAI